MRVGGVAIDAAVTAAFLAALEPVALHACLQAAEQIEQGHDAALAQHRRQVEQARYQAAKAERRYQAVDPDNRLVARGLEAAWEKALTELAAAEAELARRQAARPAALTSGERAAILALGDDLAAVWDAPTTTDKDRKQLLRTLLDEVNITLRRDTTAGTPTWCCGGKAARSASWPPRSAAPAIRTDEDTIDLVRRLAVHYPDANIAGILNRQHRRTPRGLSYTASRVQGLRYYWHIPCHQLTTGRKENRSPWPPPPANSASRPPPCTAGSTTVSSPGNRSPPRAPGASASPLSSAPCSPTPPPTAGLPSEATQAYGVSRQTIMQRVKRGELHAVHPHRTQERPAYRTPRPPRRAVLSRHNEQRSSMTMDPRTPGRPDQSSSRTPSTFPAYPRRVQRRPPRPAPIGIRVKHRFHRFLQTGPTTVWAILSATQGTPSTLSPPRAASGSPPPSPEAGNTTPRTSDSRAGTGCSSTASNASVDSPSTPGAP